jgi:hypothetical protein
MRTSNIICVTAAMFFCFVLDAQTPARFDGEWLTIVTCQASGKTEAYKLEVPTSVTDSNLHGEHSTRGEPRYLLIEGRISETGTARITATSNAETYTIRAQFEPLKGTGMRSGASGGLDRSCTFEFQKHSIAGR